MLVVSIATGEELAMIDSGWTRDGIGARPGQSSRAAACDSAELGLARGVVASRGPAFVGRAGERAVLDQLLHSVRIGEPAVLVLRGEAGIGKTALIHECARRSAGCRIAQIWGVESELEMPFAVLHQLCGSMLGALGALPEPQQRALRVAFGLAAGDAPDRFVLGLAVLGLLAEVAGDGPLVCLIDDAQWLDEPTRQVLGFVARRLQGGVLLLFAVEETGDARLFPGVPTLSLDGLADDDASALLTAAVPGHLDDQICERIVAETRGNPLGILELTRAVSAAELAGGFAMPPATVASGHLEGHYARRIRALPEPTRRLLLLAAADPTGDATLLWRAADALGVARDAAAAGESEQLLEIGSRVRFRHPLVRSAAYTSGGAVDRRAAHLALAEATDPEVDPERRVWHRAAAATGPDEDVAAELERTAVAARARGGLAASAAFLERSLHLTADPRRRADRALAAAQAHLHAGAFEAALGLLAEARAVAVDDVQRGRMERLRGQVKYAFDRGPEAPALLLKAARTLEPLDVHLAREAYLDAWIASCAAGPFARDGGLLPEVSRAARAAPSAPDPVTPCDLFLDGLASAVTDGRRAGAPSLRSALDAFLADEVPDGDVVQWGHLATHAACVMWDWRAWDVLSARHVECARTSGALTPLSTALNGRGVFVNWCGDFGAGASLGAECDAVIEATGIWSRTPCALLQAAFQGRPEAMALTSTGGAAYVSWTRAILCNGLGRYAEALDAAQHAADAMEVPTLITGWALPELIEAAVRTRQPAIAREAMARLSENTIDGDWASGIEARSRALVAEDHEAERWYVEAVARLERTPFRTEVARAHLLHGEWLRREGRRTDAREQLTRAHEMLIEIRAEGFAERARRELLANGEKRAPRSRSRDTGTDLTPQEDQIAGLARTGRTNAEIGAELFLSVRTVEWHLRKVFMKLGVKSRKELQHAWQGPTRLAWRDIGSIGPEPSPRPPLVSRGALSAGRS